MKEEFKKNDYKKPETEEPVKEEVIEEKAEPKLGSRMNVPKEGYVDTELLNVRKEASIDSQILRTISRGTKVEIVRESGEWYAIKPNGFVMSQFIK